ncbi:MAG: hypothetical protein C0497_12925 [Gemmatimonas sp.]|nr:hypothetical protein [Gemmatimonas sp.]
MKTVSLDQLGAYLHETLGLTPQFGEWPGQRMLPYALRDSFEFQTGALLGRPILLVIRRATTALTVGDVAARVRRIESTAGCPVVYVTTHMPAFERARLVALKIPFIVPGVQLYLPDLGIDFRERQRSVRQSAVAHLAPATQALLIPHLLFDQWAEDWAVTRAAGQRGYTAMTASRAARELVAAGLFTEHTVERQRFLRPLHGPRETWELARPLLRTPVIRLVWLDPDDAHALAGAPMAGVSALATLTMLGTPRWPIVALDTTAARNLRGHRVDRYASGAPVSDGPVCEVWRYAPTLSPGATTVDRLSLLLSLQTEDDARVQGALQELAEQLPW